MLAMLYIAIADGLFHCTPSCIACQSLHCWT